MGFRRVHFLDLGLLGWEEAYFIQKQFLAKRINREIGDSVICVEHEPCVTIGRLGSDSSIADKRKLEDAKIKVFHIDRGGDATYHGPGQIVLYPILDLAKLKKDVHFYIRFLEDTIINFLRRFGVIARAIPEKTGVWVRDKKIASIGIGVRRWVTFHGVSVNINNDLAPFSFIKICGDPLTQVTSLSDAVGSPRGEAAGSAIDINEAKMELFDEFRDNFRKIYRARPHKAASVR